MSGPLRGFDRGRAHVRFTARPGGVSEAPYDSLNLGPRTDDDPAAVAANRERLRGGLRLERLAGVHQVHGTRVVDAEEADPDGVRTQADGVVTREPDVGCLVMTADCLPVALLGQDRVGALHAGWRGLSGGVLEAGVAALGGPEGLVAVLGPSARGCCYEVDGEAAAAFGLGPGKHLLDLAAAARERLEAAGVEEVHDVGGCTMHEEGFFSHRVHGPATGRQGAVAWLR